MCMYKTNKLSLCQTFNAYHWRQDRPFFFKEVTFNLLYRCNILPQQLHPIKWGNDLIYSWNVI